MITTTARTFDEPTPIDDPGDVLLKVPAGVRVELREGPDGSTLVVRRSTTDAAAKPSRMQLEDDNAAGLRRHMAAAGGTR